MGLFSYSRMISSVVLRKSITRNFIHTPLVMPILFNTPHSLRMLVALNYLDPRALLEEKLKEALEKLLSNQQRKIIDNF